MVLWIVSSVCRAAEATFALIWDLTCFSMSTLESNLEHALTIVWHDWLPTLVNFLYSVILYTAPIVWQCAVAISRIIASAWMFVYSLPWRATFVSVISTSWDYASSAASLFHRQGSYAVKEVSNANYSAVWKIITETYVVLLTVTFVGVVTCVLIKFWQRQRKNRSRRDSPEAETRERVLQSQRSELAIVRQRRSHSTSQSTSQENGQNGDLSDTTRGSSSSSDVDDIS